MMINADNEQKPSIIHYAMYYGLFIGLIWIIEYMLLVAGQTTGLFMYLYYLLRIIPPVLLYIFYVKYRSINPQATKGIWNCIKLVVALCFFGGLIEGLAKYIHFAFINPSYFDQMSTNALVLIDKLTEMIPNYPEVSKDMLKTMVTNKFAVVANDLVGRLTIGFFFSLLIGFLVKIKE